MVNASPAPLLPLLRSMRPALFTVASCPASAGRMLALMPPANSVLLASISSTPVPVPLSPSVRLPSKVSWLSLLSPMCSQLAKRATPSVLTLLIARLSLPTPPSNTGNAPRCEALRLASVAVSSPSPRSTAPCTTPPSCQSTRSLPTLRRTSPRTVPPLMVTESSPPLTLMLPPI
ncbi:hypothetical protein D3C81_1022740 [compost metagenome]